MNATNNHSSTNWRAIWVLYFSGCTLALHVGKLPAALPLLVEEFDLSLAQTGDLVSIYSVLIAAGGLLCGLCVGRFGYVLFAIVGVSLCFFGSSIGAYSHSVLMLMLTRAVEGLGWIIGVVAIPVIMSTLCTDKDRPVVMGLWGAFMGVGVGSMLVLAPQLQRVGGWRLSWTVAAVISGLAAIAVLIVCYKNRYALTHLRSVRLKASQHNLHSKADVSKVAVSKLDVSMPAFSWRFSTLTQDIRHRGSVAVFVCFVCYSFQFVSVTAFLPSLLVEESGMALSTASRWTALIVIPNAIGNISAGWLINAGLKRSTILFWASVLMGLCALTTLSVQDTTVTITAALIMTSIGGIIPGTLFSTAGLLASNAAGVGVIIGFMLSGAGIGQVFGPVLLTRVVEWSNHWYAGGLLCLLVGIAGAYFARWLKFVPTVTR